MTYKEKLIKNAVVVMCIIIAVLMLLISNPPDQPRHEHIEWQVYRFGTGGAIIELPVIICWTDSAMVDDDFIHTKNSISRQYFKEKRQLHDIKKIRY